MSALSNYTLPDLAALLAKLAAGPRPLPRPGQSGPALDGSVRP